MKKISFSTRISLYLIGLVSLLFLMVFSYNYYKVHASIYTLSIENAKTLVHENVEKIERVLQKVEQVPLYIAHTLTEDAISQEKLTKLIYRFVESNPDVYGATIALAPYALNLFVENAPKYYAPYYYKKQEEIQYANLAHNEYNYWEQIWFIEPAQQEKPFWSEPYFDSDGGNTLMATYSVPIYRQNKQGEKYFFGVITADISLAWLQKIIDDITVYDTGSLSLISRTGMLIAFPNKEYINQPDYTVFDLAKEKNLPQLQELAEKITSGESGITAFQSIQTGDDMELLFTPLSSTDWSFIVTIPTKELFAELFEQSIIIVLLALIGIIGIVILVSFILYRATKPLRQLSESTKEIAQGNLDIFLPPVIYLDEIGELSLAFDHMRISLKEYIENLTKATARQERMESELKIAKNIQNSFLPKAFVGKTFLPKAALQNTEDTQKEACIIREKTPNTQKIPTIDICANLIPAREVGGDLYDFFYLDDSHIFISIGDVSGKGVPAALFMAVTQTLIKSIAMQEKDPSLILSTVNKSLAEDNSLCMFVTLFCGILNVQTGELVYSNAGHEKPILLRAHEPVSALDLPKGLGLGVFEQAKYTNKSVRLKPQDIMILYTDGVLDARSIEDVSFGKSALYSLLEPLKESSLQDVLQGIQNAVEKHAEGTEQFDDITLLALSWNMGNE